MRRHHECRRPFPAYVQGAVSETLMGLKWRHSGQTGSWGSVDMVGDTWWALFVNIDRSGKTQDLTQDDREVIIEVTCGNAAGTGDVFEQKITWKVTKIGESRQDTRYKTIEGESVPYTVTVTDHLIQIGEKMIVAADANICYVEDPPPPTRVQITNSQYPWPEGEGGQSPGFLLTLAIGDSRLFFFPLSADGRHRTGGLLDMA